MTATVTERIRIRLRVHFDLPSPAQRRALREAAGMTQGELASIVGASRAAIGHWEAGIRSPRGAKRDRYVEALRELREVVAREAA